MIQYLIIGTFLAFLSKAISPTGDQVRAAQDRSELNGYIIRVAISMVPFCMALYFFWQAIKLSGITG